MFWLTFIVLVLILWLVTRIDKCLVNPVTSTCCLWLFLISIYEFANLQLFRLSDLFYLALLLWVCPFSIVYLLMNIFFSNRQTTVTHVPSNFIFKPWFLYFFIFLMFLYGIIVLFQIKSYGVDAFFHYLREVNIDKATGEINPFEANISRIIQFSYILLLIYIARNFRFKLKPLFIILFALQLFSGANKFVLARFLFGYIVILLVKRNIGLKKIIIILLGICVLFVLLNFFRTQNQDDFNALDAIQNYLLAPLPAFDSFILNSHSDALFTSINWGEHLFASLMGKQLINPEYFENDNFVYVPLPINVFTAMSAYFVDFQWQGIFWGSVFWGLLFSYIYINSKKDEMFLILYAAWYHVLILQFFFDYLITSHARMHLVLIFTLFFVFYHPKLLYEKK